MIVHIFVVHFTLHGCWYTVLGYNSNLIFSEITITNIPILLVKHVSLLQRWSHILIQIINLMNALGLLEDNYPIGIHNVIMGVFNVVLSGV